MRAASRTPTRFEYNLPVLGVHQDVSGKSVGSCAFFPMSIARTGSDAPLRVDFSEDTPRGTGDTIRNSLWKAALVAALQKDSTLQGVRIALDFRGRYDGPSAGAVMCLAIMSALDGRGFPDDFAMTGALLPDGTIGLVGSVAEKMAAAADNPRIKRVAIPAFQRFVRTKDGGLVDFLELGRSRGLTVYLVESIFDAYVDLHELKKVSKPRLSSIVDCLEDQELEHHVVEAFTNRHAAICARINGLSSNDYETVSNSRAWPSIDPGTVGNRFQEGAIFDALDLMSHAEANLDAALESTWFFNDYAYEFLQREAKESGDSKQSLGDIVFEDWPTDKQVACIQGLYEKERGFMEQDLGCSAAGNGGQDGDGAGNGRSASDNSAPWEGFIPFGHSSDIEAQFESFLESEMASARYRYLCDNAPGPEALKKGIEDGSLNASDELISCREMFFDYLFERRLKSGFDGIPLPILNAGPGINAAFRLFRNAWDVVDETLENAVGRTAQAWGVDTDSARANLIRENIYYSAYRVSKQRVKEALSMPRNHVTCPTWTEACFLFNAAELLAESSTLLFELDFAKDNAAYVAFAIGRARSTALLSIHMCHSHDIPCFGPVLLFQRAERLRATNDRNTAEILGAYWKATMISKALVMAFRDGIGPEQGFNGYSVREQDDSQTNPPASEGTR
ncbi:MAG: hypothetical protein IJH50_04875 [Kiritimatiellae bacterium]|nr:hypothetical protein [Kiritimatiellia bacterium]